MHFIQKKITEPKKTPKRDDLYPSQSFPFPGASLKYCFALGMGGEGAKKTAVKSRQAAPSPTSAAPVPSALAGTHTTLRCHCRQLCPVSTAQQRGTSLPNTAPGTPWVLLPLKLKELTKKVPHFSPLEVFLHLGQVYAHFTHLKPLSESDLIPLY